MTTELTSAQSRRPDDEEGSATAEKIAVVTGSGPHGTSPNNEYPTPPEDMQVQGPEAAR